VHKHCCSHQARSVLASQHPSSHQVRSSTPPTCHGCSWTPPPRHHHIWRVVATTCTTCCHHRVVAALPATCALHAVAPCTLSKPTAMSDRLMFKFAQISWKFWVDTGLNFPNFVQFSELRIFKKINPKTLVSGNMLSNSKIVIGHNWSTFSDLRCNYWNITYASSNY
jgi:hypothetical protein